MSQEPRTLPKSVLIPYTGGHTAIYGGYIFELCPDHQNANPFGFVPQHRLVVERSLGRYLTRKEQVHHRDEVKTNNELSNLQVLTRSQHMALHRELERERKNGPLVREAVQQALQQGGLKKAAAALGVHTQTIRNLYPDLVAPYKRRSPNRIDDPAVIAKVLAVAPMDKVGYREVAQETGISYQTARRICERNGIDWNPKDVPTRPGRPAGTSKILNNQSMVEKVREMAPDPRYSMDDIGKVLGISGPSVSHILSVHSIHWAPKNRAGYKHKNRRKPPTRCNPDLIARVRLLAADPECGTQRAVQELGVCARTIRTICQENEIVWVAPPSGTPGHRTYRRKKSSQIQSATCASKNAFDDLFDDHGHLELPL